jgi:organic radical activating enzyme
MPNSTCRLLSNGYKFDTDYRGRLEYRPCCLFPIRQAVDAPAEDHVKYRTMLNAIDANTDSRCSSCNFFKRQDLRKTWQMHSFDIVPDDAVVGDSSYLEVQLDTTCNGGCIICGPWHSSYWAAELKQLRPPVAGNPIDTILKFIDIQQVRKITFLGGEPFLTDADYQLLKLISQPDQVTLQYTTNGSIYPTQERIDQWAQFKSVWINFSIDGVGDRFDYVRYPLKWHVVNANIRKMLKELPDNVVFKANHTVNIFNLYYHDEFDVWYDSLKNLGRIKDYTFNPAAGVVSAFSVTDKLLTLLKGKYDNNSKVLKLVNNSVDNDKTEMIEFITELDTRRGLNWRTVFPEIADCF